ncbi:Ribonuclease I precursor [Pseudovibrio axinellae]|uniref:Ribonuclease I n=1 Tax=Pseudovibrio axinellae TaxID=989403 RepID=A0A161V755_9HYPH|nr:ribonuclease T [Pseudovibrio axinellae]KZL20741.1 Ribonuclease I precursor [Pseudovibrio axinellae]SER24091.1 ribonuclease T2 [Pseudovibrio axinellae]
MHILSKVIVGAALWGVASVLPASSQVQLEGYFLAEEACPAFQSFNKQTNPGNVHVERMRAYELLGKNKANASHYFIRMNGVVPSERWVEVTCGRHLTDAESGQVAGGQQPPKTKVVRPAFEGPSRDADFVLAASWQPAFCQSHRDVDECVTQGADRFDAKNFALHGLWPQPRGNFWCGVSPKEKELAERRSTRGQLPGLALDNETREELNKVMPGTQSFLDRYEWVKHGTCYSDKPEEYYRESLDLMNQLNTSAVQDLFAAHIGNELTVSQVRAAFDRSFGAGAGDRVGVSCKGGLITELYLNLKGRIEEGSSMSDLLLAGQPTNSNCQGNVGRVDDVGFAR